MKFDNIIDESVKNRTIKWNDNPKIGWISESDSMCFYYGTQSQNIKKILKNGIHAGNDGYILMAAEPHTALAHSRMRALIMEDKLFSELDDRVVFFVEFPREYLSNKHIFVKNDYESRFTNNELYETWGKSDVEYYALIEVHVPEYVPIEFIKGYMVR